MDTEFQDMNEKIIDHFLNPRNIGELENADGMSMVGDPSCGDYIKVWIRVQNETIADFKYKVFGCWGAISTTSIVSELAIGRHLKDAIKITDDDVMRELGGIPENKQHCSLLGVQGLRSAIADYLVRDNHRKYQQRIDIFRSYGYDIPAIRERMTRIIGQQGDQARILDIGTGKGHLAIAIAQSGKKCTAVDLSPGELYMAQLNAVHFQVDEQINFLEMDAYDLQLEANSYDVVMSALFIHHLEHTEQFLAEIRRVCVPNGLIVLSDINEHGKEVIQEIHAREGKQHETVGWSIDRVIDWYKSHNSELTVINDECETIICTQNSK
ncbi:iron-sulfur cluster assembly scaffold protein [candidate division KSB1 bacterium]|nr:iron-sulfur cluster assembly scaffold protein [candidate division KSB1 bacterium]